MTSLSRTKLNLLADPTFARAFGDAFASAWDALRERGHVALSCEAEREELARYITELAGAGERDPQRLRDYALSHLGVRV